MYKNNLNKGSILILSGPSGCGKSSLLKELYKHIDNYYFSISTTTRKPRNGEKHGVDYFFTTKEEFEIGIQNNDFLEYATVHNNYYGTSLKPVNEALKINNLVIFDIDVQGHDLVQAKLNDLCTSVFITTPSLKELENRLVNRGTDNEKVIKNRLLNAKEEINYIEKYDYLIINDNLNEASEKLINIAFSSKSKTSLFNKNNIISNWLS
jgi:guanylate kinase